MRRSPYALPGHTTSNTDRQWPHCDFPQRNKCRKREKRCAAVLMLSFSVTAHSSRTFWPRWSILPYGRSGDLRFYLVLNCLKTNPTLQAGPETTCPSWFRLVVLLTGAAIKRPRVCVCVCVCESITLLQLSQRSGASVYYIGTEII